MRLRPLFVTLLTGALCTGCVVRPAENEPLIYPEELTTGELAFGRAIAPVEELDLLSRSPEMDAFLEQFKVGESRIAFARFQRIMDGLTRLGYFDDNYEHDGTYSAAETFARARGNCLGYTNMFIALSRAAGLPARYQLVESDPKWDVKGDLLVRNNHINLELGEMAMLGASRTKIVVDFNQAQPDGEIRSRIVSDEFAAALFYANIAVKHMAEGRMEDAFANLRRGIETHPRNKALWNNLGVLYSRLEKLHLAREAFSIALQIDPGDKTAWTGMAAVLDAMGQYAEAQEYARRVKRYRDRNPYFHYAIATDAFQTASYDEALVAIESAIDLNGSDARFFALRASVAEAIGDEQLARRSIRLAKLKARKRATGMSASYYGDDS